MACCCAAPECKAGEIEGRVERLEAVVERRTATCSGCVERQEIIDRLREEIAPMIERVTE